MAKRLFIYGTLHRVTVTEANHDCIGSITIDPLLLEAAGIDPPACVDAVNISCGDRVQTHVIEDPGGSGDVCVNGAAAHHFNKGELAIVMGYEQVPVSDLSGRISRAVLVDDHNRIKTVRNFRTPALDEPARPENNRLGEVYPSATSQPEVSTTLLITLNVRPVIHPAILFEPAWSSNERLCFH